jgi:hypothetical protein
VSKISSFLLILSLSTTLLKINVIDQLALANTVIGVPRAKRSVSLVINNSVVGASFCSIVYF